MLCDTRIISLGAAPGAAIILVAGCMTVPQASTQGPRHRRDEAAIRSYAQSYAQSFESGDPDGVVALTTDDFVALTPGKSPIVGRDAARREIAADLDQLDVERLRFEPVEIVVQGNWAWTWGRSDAVMKPRDTGETVRVTGKYLWILRRHTDGKWRIARDSAHGS